MLVPTYDINEKGDFAGDIAILTCNTIYVKTILTLARFFLISYKMYKIKSGFHYL